MNTYKKQGGRGSVMVNRAPGKGARPEEHSDEGSLSSSHDDAGPEPATRVNECLFPFDSTLRARHKSPEASERPGKQMDRQTTGTRFDRKEPGR
jgi:hypothetical protein